MTAFDEYQSLRTTFAVYPRGRAVARVSGPEREGFLSGLLARTVEFSGPGTLLESLVLDEEGRPIDQVLVLVEDDDLLVLSDDPARFPEAMKPALSLQETGSVTHEPPVAVFKTARVLLKSSLNFFLNAGFALSRRGGFFSTGIVSPPPQVGGVPSLSGRLYEIA